MDKATESQQRYLTSFAKRVVAAAKKRVKPAKATGALEASINYKIQETKDGFTVEFLSTDYGTFIDKGVSGKETRRYYKDINGKRRQSPYRYKSKYPPVGAIDRWTAMKVSGARDDKGRFIKRKSLVYLISRKIFLHGIQGLSFYSQPLREQLKDFKTGYSVSFKNDFMNKINTVIKKK
mgnify:CR=1 FL=1